MSKRPQRLGRGLESLIGMGDMGSAQADAPRTTAAAQSRPSNAPQAVEPAIPVRMVNLDTVEPNPFQPRQQFDEAALAELAASIRTDGILQPIAVRPVNGKFQIIAGERRCRAARMAGLKEVPAIVRDTDDREMLALALTENIQREDLNAVEKAQAYEQLRLTLAIPIEQLAKRLGQDRSTVSNFLRLLELDELSQSWIRSGRLSMGQARAVLGAEPEHRTRLARQAVEQELSVRAVERMVQLVRQGIPEKKKNETRPLIKSTEQQFTKTLGVKAKIKESPKGKSGRIVLYYRTLDDFERICDRLNISTEE